MLFKNYSKNICNNKILKKIILITIGMMASSIMPFLHTMQDVVFDKDSIYLEEDEPVVILKNFSSKFTPLEHDLNHAAEKVTIEIITGNDYEKKSIVHMMLQKNTHEFISCVVGRDSHKLNVHGIWPTQTLKLFNFNAHLITKLRALLPRASWLGELTYLFAETDLAAINWADRNNSSNIDIPFTCKKWSNDDHAKEEFVSQVWHNPTTLHSIQKINDQKFKEQYAGVCKSLFAAKKSCLKNPESKTTKKNVSFDHAIVKTFNYIGQQQVVCDANEQLHPYTIFHVAELLLEKQTYDELFVQDKIEIPFYINSLWKRKALKREPIRLNDSIILCDKPETLRGSSLIADILSELKEKSRCKCVFIIPNDTDTPSSNKSWFAVLFNQIPTKTGRKVHHYLVADIHNHNRTTCKKLSYLIDAMEETSLLDKPYTRKIEQPINKLDRIAQYATPGTNYNDTGYHALHNAILMLEHINEKNMFKLQNYDFLNPNHDKISLDSPSHPWRKNIMHYRNSSLNDHNLLNEQELQLLINSHVHEKCNYSVYTNTQELDNPTSPEGKDANTIKKNLYNTPTWKCYKHAFIINVATDLFLKKYFWLAVILVRYNTQNVYFIADPWNMHHDQSPQLKHLKNKFDAPYDTTSFRLRDELLATQKLETKTFE